jgi:hypothetical protein
MSNAIAVDFINVSASSSGAMKKPAFGSLLRPSLSHLSRVLVTSDAR